MADSIGIESHEINDPWKPARANGVASQRSYASISSDDLKIPLVQYRALISVQSAHRIRLFVPRDRWNFLLNYNYNN